MGMEEELVRMLSLEEDQLDEETAEPPNVGIGQIMFKENVIALTFIRIFALLSMTASGFIIRDISRKLTRSSGSFLTRVSLTQSILIVLAVADFFG